MFHQDFEWVGTTRAGRKGPRFTVRINGEAGAPPTAYYGGVRYALDVDPFEVKLPFADVACMYHYDSIPREWAEIIHQKDETWIYVLLLERRGQRYAFELRRGGAFDDGEAEAAFRDELRALHGAFERRDLDVLGRSCLVDVARVFFRKRRPVAVDRRLVLGSLEASVDGVEQGLFALDGEARWGELPPWTELRLRARPGQSLRLRFHVLEDRRRIYVGHQDFDWRAVCTEGHVELALGRHDADPLVLRARLDEEGSCEIDAGVLETPMCLKFTLAAEGRRGGGEITEGQGEIMLRWGRPIEQRLDVHDWQPDNWAPGEDGSNLVEILRRDLLSAYNPDRDHFADVVLGQSLPPDPAHARVLVAAGLEGDAVARYVRRAEAEARRSRPGDEGERPFESWLVGALRGKALDGFLRAGAERLRDEHLPRQVWTREDAEQLLECLAVLRVEARPGRVRAVMDFAEAFVERIEGQVEPTFYVHQLRRPTKRFMANGDVARPHAWAVLALLGLKEAFHGEGALAVRGRTFAVDPLALDELMGDQADHVIREHDLERDGPDFMLLFDRKRHVSFQPYVDCVQAFKILVAHRAERRWANFLREIRGQILEKFRTNYRVTGIQQRVELLHTTLPGVLPFFQGVSPAVAWDEREGSPTS